ncbi:MAG: hypothetical protein ACFFD2_04225 [Promethearchaeota archaeon]
MVKLEIGRYKLDYMNFNDWVQELESNINVLASFQLENECILDSHNYGCLITAISSIFSLFFSKLGKR